MEAPARRGALRCEWQLHVCLHSQTGRSRSGRGLDAGLWVVVCGLREGPAATNRVLRCDLWLLNDSERQAVEASFAVCANFLYQSAPSGIGVASDMASRLMNPAADRPAAVGLIALAIPSHANASSWLRQSVREFKWMLENGVMRDGQWHEPSTRYHGRVLAAFIPFAYALRKANAMNIFEGTDRAARNFKNFVGWYTKIQTPPDETFGGCSLTPALSMGIGRWYGR